MKGAVSTPTITVKERAYSPVAMRGDGKLRLQMRWLCDKPPFENEALREKLRSMCNEFLAEPLGAERMTGFPKIDFAKYTAMDSGDALIAMLDWMVNQIRSA